MCQDALKDIPPHIQDNIVAEMWDIQSRWKWNLLVDLLPEEALRKIATFAVTPGDDNEDQIV